MRQPETGPRRPWGRWLFTAAFAVGCSTLAFLQPPASDADAPPSGWRALLHPVERNAWLRIGRGQHLSGEAGLESVQAGRDGRTVVVGVSDGTVLRSGDGGRGWEALRIALPPGTALRSVRFADERRGWALLSDGALRTTPDGGRSWEPEPLPGESRVWSIAVSRNGKHAAALGASAVWRWRAGEGWQSLGSTYGLMKQQRPMKSQETDVTGWDVPLLATSTNGRVALARAGIVLRSDGSGWRASPVEATFRPRAIQLDADGDRVRLVGDDGSIRLLDGDSLREQYRDPGRLYDLDVLEDGRGWAVGTNGHVVTTRDGSGWLTAPRAAGATLTAIAMTWDGWRGWALSGDPRDGSPPGTGTVWHTGDGGETWSRQLVLAETFHPATVERDGVLRLTTSAGAELRSPDGGWTWRVAGLVPEGPRSPAPAPEEKCGDVRCSHPVTVGTRGWAVALEGPSPLLTTWDGGRSWTPTARAEPRLTWIVGGKRDGRTFFVGSNGATLYTADGGSGWQPVTYGWWPAPWYFLSWIVVVLLVRRSTSRFGPARSESVADLLVTDRPIEDITDDVLGIHELAQGISRFIRNEQTQPSLTMAVSGEWGTGKSSLLNLLQADLRRFGFSPVWFNAWHHEQEENLIASLYARIIAQGTPSLPSWEALMFRWRLLRRQTGRHSAVFLLSALLFAAGAGYFVARQEHLTNLLERVRNTLTTVSDYLSSVGEEKPEPPAVTKYSVTLRQTKDGAWEGGLESQPAPAGAGTRAEDPPSQWIAALSALLGVLGLGRSLLQRLQAFGVDPARFAASIAGSDRARDHRESVGFHARFARDFADVTRALAPRRMVILVDDLDRCSPASTLKMLEAINFLVTSGQCFVVMAISERVIEEYLASQFKDMVASEPPLPGQASTTHERQLAYARKYLEKLINVEVRLPPMERSQAHALLTQHHGCDDPRPDLEQQSRQEALQLAQRRRDASEYAGWLRTRLALAVVVGLCLGAGLYGGSLARHRAARGPAETQEPFTAQAPGSASAPVSTSAASPPPPSEDMLPGGTWALREPVSGPPRWWVFVSAFVAIAALLLWTIRQHAVVVRDSHAFLDALLAWNDIIAERNPTPRALKKFLNRVRFYAMQQRPVLSDEQDFLSGLVEAWLTGYERGGGLTRIGQGLMAVARHLVTPPRPPPGEVQPAIPEHLLVAMAALSDAAPELLRSPDFARMLATAALPVEGPLGRACNDLVAKAGFPVIGDAERAEMVAAFKRMAGGLEVR